MLTFGIFLLETGSFIVRLTSVDKGHCISFHCEDLLTPLQTMCHNCPTHYCSQCPHVLHFSKAALYFVIYCFPLCLWMFDLILLAFMFALELTLESKNKKRVFYNL